MDNLHFLVFTYHLQGQVHQHRGMDWFAHSLVKKLLLRNKSDHIYFKLSDAVGVIKDTILPIDPY